MHNNSYASAGVGKQLFNYIYLLRLVPWTGRGFLNPADRIAQRWQQWANEKENYHHIDNIDTADNCLLWTGKQSDQRDSY